MVITLRPVELDADYVAWRRVRIAVVPAERCDTVEELRRDPSASRLLLLAMRGGDVAGCGLADRSETAGGGFVEPQVVPGFRRQGIGGALLRALAGHVWRLGMSAVRASAEDPGSLAFARRFGFGGIDRQIEQIRPVGAEPIPAGPTAGVEIVTLSDRPGLWGACFEGFGQQVLANFALADRLQVSRAQWETRRAHAGLAGSSRTAGPH